MAAMLLVVSILAFGLLHVAPGDPATLLYGSDLSHEQLAQVRAAWGLDAPLPVQYVLWLGNILRGDMGRSFVDGRPALEVIAERVPATLELTLTGLLAALIAGPALGTLAALRPGAWLSRAASFTAVALYSLPSFWLALLLILVFSVQLRWLPSAGMESLRGATGPLDRLAHLAMPAFVLSLRETGRLMRFTRASVSDILGQDYVRLAYAKGLTESQAVVRHVLRNAALPVITLLGLAVPQLLSSSIVVETVFAWPGIGRLVVESAFQRNYTVLMGEIVIVSVLVAVGSLVADIGYAWADPRVRLGE
jgi:peptide/nickel transport system permease protein